MKPWKKTSKCNNKRGGNKKLREKINKAIDKEMNKAPEEIDTCKVDALVIRLNELNKNLNASEALSKEAFAQKFLSEYIDFNRLINEKNKK